MSKLQHQINELEAFWKELLKFNNSVITKESRKQLMELINNNKYFTRKDVDNRVTLSAYGHMMSPEFEISNVNGKFYVMDCSFIRMMEGMYEQLQEEGD
jgi:hypothetical protein